MEKPTFGEKFRALLATGRIANLPTVWSNVLVGFWIASFITGEFSEKEVPRIFLLLITGMIASCVYVAGCLLGDAVDHDFDSQHRPSRPIPQGVLSPGSVKFTAYCLFALALLGMFGSTFIAFVSAYYIEQDIQLTTLIKEVSHSSSLAAIQIHELIVGCSLIACVIAYAYFHKRIGKSALFLMATCRFLLVLYAISTAHKSFFDHAFISDFPLQFHVDWVTPWMLILAAAVGIYTLLLSWVASTESDSGLFRQRTILGALLLTVPFLTLLFHMFVFRLEPVDPLWSEHTGLFPWHDQKLHWGCYYTAMICVLMWLLFALKALQKSKPAFVSRALAGFCLLDAAFIAPFFPIAALICAGLFAFALLLQKVAPAT